MTAFARANLPTLKKTGSYYVMHILVAAAVAFFFHEKVWQRVERSRIAQSSAVAAAS